MTDSQSTPKDVIFPGKCHPFSWVFATLLVEWPRYPPIRHRNKCHDVQFSPGGRLVAVASYDGSVQSGLLSGQRLHEGGGTVNLSAAEWLDRWRAYRH
jgi:hypothetical protein